MLEYISNGGHALVDLMGRVDVMNNKRIKVLKYENFLSNHTCIYDYLDRIFRTRTCQEDRDKISKLYSIDHAIKIMGDLEGDDFFTYDAKTMIHNNHISKYRGNTDYRELLSESQLDILRSNHVLSAITQAFYPDDYLLCCHNI